MSPHADAIALAPTPSTMSAYTRMSTCATQAGR